MQGQPEMSQSYASLHSGTRTDGPSYSSTNLAASSSRRGLSKKAIIGIAVGTIVVVAAAVGVGVGVSKSKSSSSEGASSGAGGKNGGGGGSGGSGSHGGSCGGDLTGSDGSTVTMENGTTFVYRNAFGGNWTAIPYDDSARPQADTPTLAERWDYSRLRIQGVNLGGWLVLEPFISPAVFEPFLDRANPQVLDEWTMCEQLLIDDPTGKKRDAYLEEHYKTFITEEDFARVAGAGLNWVRLAVPFWMIEQYPGEPFATSNITWTYFLKGLGWARKYGLRVNLDLHTVPGSANGFNQGGRQAYGPAGVNVANGPMGVANVQRGLNYIRALAEFIARPGYKNVVPMFSPTNEPMFQVIGEAALDSYYTLLYENIRSVTGFGEGNGPIIGFHDGFEGQTRWINFLPGADRIAIDNHPYFAFSPVQNNDPMSANVMKPCNQWGNAYNTSANGRGIQVGGEYSLAINDCSLWLNNIDRGNRYDGTYPASTAVGSCAPFLDWTTWNQTFKDGMKQMVRTSMDAMGNSFFWTWKIGPSTRSNITPNPFWSYSLGLDNGWIDANPRHALGACAAAAVQYNTPIASPVAFTAFPSAAATGGAGAADGVAAAAIASHAWPPAISNAGGVAAAALPQYTQTGTPIVLAGETPACTPKGQSINLSSLMSHPTPTATPVNNAAAPIATGWYVPVSGCQYPDAWTGVGQPIPNPVCGVAAGAAAAAATPAPAAANADRKRGAIPQPHGTGARKFRA